MPPFRYKVSQVTHFPVEREPSLLKGNVSFVYCIQHCFYLIFNYLPILSG
jgi:hypothetical protein